MKASDPIPVQRLNHAVLYVADAACSADFYSRLFGFEKVAEEGPMIFLRAAGSSNHHDLGLFGLGHKARRPPQGSTGLYHLAWQVETMEELARARKTLRAEGAYAGESDHGATKSVYGNDPDGHVFEIMVLLPKAAWGEYENRAPVMPLHWPKDLNGSQE